MSNLEHIKLTDFGSTGWKLHIPVSCHPNDPLTKVIAVYLDNKLNVDHYGDVINDAPNLENNGFHAFSKEQSTSVYKVGRADQLDKGITIYTNTPDKAKQIAGEIEDLFGKDIANHIKNTNQPLPKEANMTKHVYTRFYSKATDTVNNRTFHMRYPSGIYSNSGIGVFKGAGYNFHKLPQMDQAKVVGKSLESHITMYGELFTGKLENGKPSKWLISLFPKEYLKNNPTLIDNLPKMVKKGNINLCSQYIRTIAENDDIFETNDVKRLIASFDKNIFDESLENLKQFDLKNKTDLVSKLEKTMPKFCQLKIFEDTIETVSSNITKPNTVNKSKVVTEVAEETAMNKILSNTVKEGTEEVAKKISKSKITGIAIVALAIAGIAYATINSKNEKSEVTVQSNQLSKVQNPNFSPYISYLKTNPYNTYNSSVYKAFISPTI